MYCNCEGEERGEICSPSVPFIGSHFLNGDMVYVMIW